MKRQLRKVIFLPACEEVLTDSEFVGPVYKKVREYESYYASKWDKFWKRKSKRYTEVTMLDQGNETNLQGSIWRAIEHCREYGYDIILYPENGNALISEEILMNSTLMKQVIRRRSSFVAGRRFVRVVCQTTGFPGRRMNRNAPSAKGQ